MKWTIITCFAVDALLGLFLVSHPEIPESIAASVFPPPPPPPQNSENHNEHKQVLDVLTPPIKQPSSHGIRGKSQQQEREEATDKSVDDKHTDKQPSLRGARDSTEQEALKERQDRIVVLQEMKSTIERQIASLEQPLHNEDKKKPEDSNLNTRAALVEAISKVLLKEHENSLKEVLKTLEWPEDPNLNNSLKELLKVLEQQKGQWAQETGPPQR